MYILPKMEGCEQNGGMLKKMVEAKKAKLGVSCVAGAAYVAWVLCYVVKSGGEMWGGIATWVVWPHIICAALAALFGAAGMLRKQSRLLLYAAAMYGIAAVLFPPFHVFLILPLLLMGSWYLDTLQPAEA